MKEEYDFSTAERGKFFRQGARLVPPVHLEPDVLDHLSRLARHRVFTGYTGQQAAEARDQPDQCGQIVPPTAHAPEGCPAYARGGCVQPIQMGQMSPVVEARILRWMGD